MHDVMVLSGVARSVIAVDEIVLPERSLDYLQRTILARFELQCQAWCYMPNHTTSS